MKVCIKIAFWLHESMWMSVGMYYKCKFEPFVKNRIIIALFIAWKCVTKCVKVSPMEFLPRINTFLVLYILKLAEIAKSYLKLCKNVWIGVWKYQQYNSDYEYNLFGTQCVENGKKAKFCEKLCENCILIARMCVIEYIKLFESISNYFFSAKFCTFWYQKCWN